MGSAVRRLVVVLISAATIVSGAGFPTMAANADTVDFDGSGWGHGVGMSQWGAQAMALEGKTYKQILSHYFRGTSLTTLPSNEKIWVNLEEKFTSRNLTVAKTSVSAGVPLIIEGESSAIVAQPGATVALSSHGGSGGCVIKVTQPGGGVEQITDNSQCDVDMIWDGNSSNPTTKVLIQGCTNVDWNASGSPAVPCQYARGVLHLRSGTGGLYLSAEMDIDDYVLGISEVPRTWHLESQKAQTVAARSYAVARAKQRGNPVSSDYNGCWCHVRDTTSDQRYAGWGHTVTDVFLASVSQTAREVVTHEDSNLAHDVVATYYSSSTGGRTEHGHVVGFSSGPVEWLTSVDDSWAVDGSVPNPNRSWVKSVNSSTVAQSVGFDIVTSVEVTSTRPGSGSAAMVGIEGILNGEPASVSRTSPWVRRTYGLKSEYFDVNYTAPPGSQLHQPGDEMLFYRSDGAFRYYSVHPNAVLGATIQSGNGYTSGWKSISAVDLDGDGRDEIMFYREDGLYRYYRIGADGRVGAPVRAGDDYTAGWDSITAVDLNGDGQDELFFYRNDGLYRFYNVRSDGRIGSPIRAGDDYTKGWDSITAVDLNGDGQDEMFFYRSDGLYRYYNVRSNGRIGSPITSGDDYSAGWDVITAVDLDGDGQDEMFFYREDGRYAYYNVRPNGRLGSPIRSGTGYASGWSVITAINLDGK